MLPRPATLDESECVAEIARAAYGKYVSRIGRAPAPMVADFTRAIAAGQVHVLEHPDHVVAFVVFYPRDDHLHLENVAVHPDWQGRGLGRQLVAFVEAEARRHGVGAVELYTNALMTDNLALYPRLGYRELGRWWEDGFDRVFFRKQL